MMDKLKDLIKNIPQGSRIPCKYTFRDGPTNEGLLYSNENAVFLKHNWDHSHNGDGQRIEGYKYSWFLYNYITNAFDLDGIKDITADIFCITIGEL